MRITDQQAQAAAQQFDHKSLCELKLSVQSDCVKIGNKTSV